MLLVSQFFIWFGDCLQKLVDPRHFFVNMHDLIVIKKIIENLYPDEAYILLDELEAKEKSTLSNDIMLHKEAFGKPSCPFCQSNNVVRNGKRLGKQTFYCKNCEKYFTYSTNTAVDSSKSVYKTWISFIHYTIKGMTLANIADEIHVSQTTAFNMRHKLFKAIAHIRDSTLLSGQIQLDGKFVPMNFKGTKSENMPRLSKMRSSRSKTPLAHKVCIMTAIDSDDHIFMEITGVGEETNEMMHVFDGRIAPGSLLVTDGKFAFETYAKNNNLNIEIVKSSKFTNEHDFNLAEVNGLHSQLDIFLKRCRGVSTRHLQGYLTCLY